MQVRLAAEGDFARQQMGELDGLLLDRLDIETDVYEPAPHLLRADRSAAGGRDAGLAPAQVELPVTGQPDWGSVQIRYVGAPIDQKACSST